MSDQTQAPDFLNMSDDEIMKLGAPDMNNFTMDAPEQPDTPEVNEDVPAADTADEVPESQASAEVQEEQASDEPASSSTEEGDPASNEEVSQDAPASQAPAAGTQEAQADAGTEAAQGEGKEASDEQEAPAIDYEAEFKKLMAPFKANGRDFQVANVEEAITLMQMGAGFNKKMAALKPNLKIMKMLQEHDLLDESKLSFLIDVSKKNPAAISKLVKDSGIDYRDLDEDQANSYKAQNYSVSDAVVEIDQVLDEIESSPTFTRTIDVITKEWDQVSRNEISKDPRLIKVIDDHIQRGVYDIIKNEIDRQQVLGRLNGLSALQAYQQVGDAINRAGGFDHLVQKAANQGQQNPPAPQVIQPKPRQVNDDNRDKKKAASPSKPSAPAGNSNQQFNPLALSDEDFAKMVQPKFV